MIVTTSTVLKLSITDVPHTDPIAVYLEDQGEARGKVTITCFNDCWSYFWGAMGKGYDIRKFFLSCDVDYLAGKFRGSAPRTEPDPDKLTEKAKQHLLERRREGYIDKEKAREHYALTENLFDLWHEMNGHSEAFMDAMYAIFGDEWYERIPTKPHHQYEYLCRIVNTVKAALEQEGDKLTA